MRTDPPDELARGGPPSGSGMVASTRSASGEGSVSTRDAAGAGAVPAACVDPGATVAAPVVSARAAAAGSAGLPAGVVAIGAQPELATSAAHDITIRIPFMRDPRVRAPPR